MNSAKSPLDPRARARHYFQLGVFCLLLTGWPMFILFLLPGIPKDLLCYIAGLTPMHVVTFLVISTVGRFPGVLLFSVFGDGLAERDWQAVGVSTAIALGLMGLVYLLRAPIERFASSLW